MSVFMLEYNKVVDYWVRSHQNLLRNLIRTFQQKYYERLEEHGINLDRLFVMEEKYNGTFISMHQEEVTQAKT